MSFVALSQQGADMAAQYGNRPRKESKAKAKRVSVKPNEQRELCDLMMQMLSARGSFTREHFPGVHEYKFKMATFHLKDKIQYVGHAPRGDWRLRQPKSTKVSS